MTERGMHLLLVAVHSAYCRFMAVILNKRWPYANPSSTEPFGVVLSTHAEVNPRVETFQRATYRPSFVQRRCDTRLL